MSNTNASTSIAERISAIYASTEDWRVNSEVSGDTLLVNTVTIPYDVLAQLLTCHDLDSRASLYINTAGNWSVYCPDTDKIYEYIDDKLVALDNGYLA